MQWNWGCAGRTQNVQVQLPKFEAQMPKKILLDRFEEITDVVKPPFLTITRLYLEQIFETQKRRSRCNNKYWIWRWSYTKMCWQKPLLANLWSRGSKATVGHALRSRKVKWSHVRDRIAVDNTKIKATIRELESDVIYTVIFHIGLHEENKSRSGKVIFGNVHDAVQIQKRARQLREKENPAYFVLNSSKSCTFRVCSWLIYNFATYLLFTQLDICVKYKSSERNCVNWFGKALNVVYHGNLFLKPEKKSVVGFLLKWVRDTFMRTKFSSKNRRHLLRSTSIKGLFSQHKVDNITREYLGSYFDSLIRWRCLWPSTTRLFANDLNVHCMTLHRASIFFRWTIVQGHCLRYEFLPNLKIDVPSTTDDIYNLAVIIHFELYWMLQCSTTNYIPASCSIYILSVIRGPSSPTADLFWIFCVISLFCF